MRVALLVLLVAFAAPFAQASYGCIPGYGCIPTNSGPPFCSGDMLMGIGSDVCGGIQCNYVLQNCSAIGRACQNGACVLGSGVYSPASCMSNITVANTSERRTFTFISGICMSSCTNGAKQCLNNSAEQLCGDFNNDGCYEWGTPVGCPAGYSCSGGVCNPGSANTITLVSPPHGTSYSTNASSADVPLRFQTNYAPYGNVCTLTLNGSLNKTKTISGIYSGALIADIETLAVGPYSWNVSCPCPVDPVAFCNAACAGATPCFCTPPTCAVSYSQNWQFSVANACGNHNCDQGESCASCPGDCGNCPPSFSLSFVYPTPSNGTVQSANWALINVSGTRSVSSVNISFGPSGSQAALPMAAWGISAMRNMTALQPGTYLYSAYGCDVFRNCSQTETRVLTVTGDTTPPTIVLHSPSDSYSSSSSLVFFNFTATDNSASVLDCSLYVDGSVWARNSSTQNGTPTWFALNNFSINIDHYWNITCSDAPSCACGG